MSDSRRPLSRLHPLVAPAIVFVVALLLRLIVLHQVSQDKSFNQPTGDGLAYLTWAGEIVEHGWIGDAVFYQTPLYPYLLAVLRGKLGFGLTEIRIFQAVLGALSCALLALGTARFFNRTAGLIAGLMLAFYPAIVSFDLQIDKGVLDPFLMAGLIACMAGVMRRPSGWRLLGCGVLCGLAALNRENALILVPVLVVWCFWLGRRLPAQRRWSWVGALIGGVACVLVPVSLRNSLIGHEFHLITAQFGPNFYIGNSAGADGIYSPLLPDRGDAQFERIDATALAEKAAGHSLTPSGVSRYWTARTLDDIAADPGRWLNLLMRKIALVFTRTELSDSDVHDRFVVYSPVLSFLEKVWGFGILLPLAAAGTALAWHRRRRWWPIAVMAIVFAPSVALFYVFARYRLTLVTMLIPFAAVAIARIPAAFKRPLIFAPAGAVAILAAALVWISGAVEPVRIKGTNSFNRANLAIEHNQPDRAINLFQRAIDENPAIAKAHRNLGRLLNEKRDWPNAAAKLAEAVRLAPDDPDAQIELGVALGQQKQYEQAVGHFWAALQLKPDSSTARCNLGIALLAMGRREEGIEVLQPLASTTSSDPMAQQAAAILSRLPAPTTRGQ